MQIAMSQQIDIAFESLPHEHDRSFGIFNGNHPNGFGKLRISNTAKLARKDTLYFVNGLMAFPASR